jgi:hypothetical protein
MSERELSVSDAARVNALVGLSGVVALLVAYMGSFGLHRFHDDWAFVYRASEAVNGNLISFIFGPFYQHWSPLWHATETLNFNLAGWKSDWFIRSFIVCMHVLSLVAAWLTIRRMRFGIFGAVATIGVMGLHHAQAAAIYSFDTYSQCAADTLGWLGVIAFWNSLHERQPWRSTAYWGALVLLLLALLFKEQALAAAGVYVVFAIVHFAQAGEYRRWLHRVWQTCMPVVGITVGFALIRALSGLFLEKSGAFGFSPSSAPANMAQLGLALITPLRTLVWFDALKAQPVQLARLVPAACLSILLLSVLLAGAIVRMRRCPEYIRVFWMLAGAIIVSWYPVAIMAHMGELYVHTSLFWFALFVGYATDGWAMWLERGRPMRVVTLTLCIVAYCACLGYGLRSNLAEIRTTAERAVVWMERFDDALSAVPSGSRVLIYNHSPDRGDRDYGLYRVTTVQYLMLTEMSRPALSYLTDSSVHFYQVLGQDEPDPTKVFPDAAADTAVYELHIRNDVIKISRK